MKNRRAQGFTLIELLIVIAIIGILAAVLIPNLLSARGNAVQRAAQAYGQNVYKAAFAYIAQDPNNVLPATQDCRGGYSIAGSSFSTPDPGTGTVAACTVTVTAGTPSVQVTASTAGASRVFNTP